MLFSGRVNQLIPSLPVSALVEFMKDIPDREKSAVRRLFELINTDRLEDARDLYHRTPGLDARFYDWGVAFQEQENFDKAMGLYQQSLDLDPDNTRIINAIGAIYHRQGRFEQALAQYQKALDKDPEFIPALLNIARIRLQKVDWVQAQAICERILARDPDNLHAVEVLIRICMNACRWDELDAYAARLRDLIAQWVVAGRHCRLSLFDLYALPFSAAQLQVLVENHAQAIARKMASPRQKLNFPSRYRARAPKRRLRIGYVSPDFKDHPLGNLMWRLFELHDRNVFDVYGYALGPDDKSIYRNKFAKDFDIFRDVQAMNPTEIACQIYADSIDILVDLGAYTGFAKPEVFALRPAPVQVYYLGGPGNTGADYIDYMITDQVLTPAQQERHIREACVHLPACSMINNNQQPLVAASRRSDWGLPDQGFVFCSFNRASKIERRMFTTWMNILKQVPDSILWLLPTYGETIANLQAEAVRQGVDAERLVFADFVPGESREQYLSRQACADLFLDTLYFTGNVSVSNALWAGVPVLTCAGETHCSRLAASVLHGAGMADMVVSSLQDYETRAVRLANDADELKRLKNYLTGNRLNLPLFDTRKTVHYLERAYQSMWDNYNAGRAPQRMLIAPDHAH